MASIRKEKKAYKKYWREMGYCIKKVSRDEFITITNTGKVIYQTIFEPKDIYPKFKGTKAT